MEWLQYPDAWLYRYRFTTRQERRESGAWWARWRVGERIAPMRLAKRRADDWRPMP